MSPLKLNSNFANEIKNDEDVNNETFREYSRFQNPSCLAKDLLETNQVKNNQIELLNYLFNE